MINFFRKNRPDLADQTCVFSANLSLFSSIYFVGRSVPQNILHISPFIILTLFLLIGSLYRYITLYTVRIIILITVFMLFIVYPSYSKKEFLVPRLINKYEKLIAGHIFSSELDQELKVRFTNDVELIKKYIKNDEILIVSDDSIFLLYLVGKKNLLMSNPTFGIEMESELWPAIRYVTQKCPKIIVTDCTIFDRCKNYESFSKVAHGIVLPELLRRIEEKCRVQYRPVICTDQICIAKYT